MSHNNTLFNELEIDHKTYDTIELLATPIHKIDFGKAFYMELQKLDMYNLMDLFAMPIEDILRLNCYTAKEIHLLLELQNEHNLKFGDLPDWILHFKTNWKDYDVERFLHAKLYAVQWPFQSPSFNRKERILLKEEFGVERIYQLLRIDRQKVAEVKYTGKKILENLDFFIRNNDIEALKIKGTNPKNL